MKKILIFFSLIQFLLSDDTFSIVAVDTVTGQVGSAGASCIQGSIIISDVHPGLGAIHTQSYWKGHKVGDTYAIQGNILLGQSILDNMEEAFLTQYGTFEE